MAPWICFELFNDVAVSSEYYTWDTKDELRVYGSDTDLIVLLSRHLPTEGERSNEIPQSALPVPLTRHLPNKCRFTHSMPFPCRAHAVPLPWRAAKGLECVFPIWFTQCGRVWFTFVMTCHAPTMPFFSRPQHGRLSTAVLCRGLENKGMVRAWRRRDMASVNQTRPHCVNQMGKTHSSGTAWQGNGMGAACYVWIGLYWTYPRFNNRPIDIRECGVSECCVSDDSSPTVQASCL